MQTTCFGGVPESAPSANQLAWRQPDANGHRPVRRTPSPSAIALPPGANTPARNCGVPFQICSAPSRGR